LAGGWARNPLWKTARAVPSLDLRFADNKTLGDASSGSNPVTFTRASSGTYVGSNGLIKTATTNEPRFDHNPTTGESLGLLVEEARTNLLLRSEEFDNASWSKTNSSAIANSITSPDSLLTADKLVEDTSAGGHVFVQEISGLPDNTTYTASVFCKAAERNWVAVTVVDKLGILNRVWYNVATGVQGTTNGTVSAFSATLFSNGWYRLAVSASTSTGAGAGGVRVSLGTADNTAAYTGNGTSGIYLWGAQLEAGAFATSYIPTTTATVTRAADVASITGSNFSSWYNQTEGTVFAEFGPYGNGGASTNAGIAQLDGGSSANSIRMFGGSTVSPVLDVTVSSANQAYISAGALTSSTISKITAAYKVNDFARVFNGPNIGTDASGTVPTVNQMLIANGSGGVGSLNGTIKRLAYWGTRLPNNILQQITQP
jgi:hypothetical protein